MPAKEFLQHEVLRLQEVNKHNGDKTVLRIVSFGKQGTPLLEKRLFYKTENDHLPGKRVGINYEDFEYIIEHQEEVSLALASKTAVAH